MRKSNVIPILILAASLALGASAVPVADPAQSSAAAPDSRGAQLIEAGRALEMSGQKDEALADYTAAIESHALDRDARTRALFDRGLLLDGMNRLDDALKDYSAALSVSPKFAAALNNRANIYRRLNRFTEAQHDYRASLAAGNPQTQYPYYGLGQIAEAQGRTDQARNFYTKALVAAPDFVLARRKMAALDAPQAIHLHPPQKIAQAAKAVDPVILRPPPARLAQARSAPVRLRPPEPVPTSYDKDSPALKPALDRAGLGSQVQLGAWRTEAEATQGWNRAVRQAAGVLEGYSPHIVAVDLPGAGRYYRLRVATDKSGSNALCAALTAKGLACIPAGR
jgi:tetratricopeptide (TPR) repeat protein